MPKRTVFLAIIIAITTALLVFLASRQQQLPKTQAPTKISAPSTIEKTASLYFSPTNSPQDLHALEELEVRVNDQTSLDVIVDTGKYPITGVQFELQYDPNVLSNLSVTTPKDSFFGESNEYFELFSDVDSNNGRVSYAVAINPKAETKQGVGKVATIKFAASNKSNQESTPIKSGSTTISFIDKTLVTKEGVTESVLKETKPLTIIFSP